MAIRLTKCDGRVKLLELTSVDPEDLGQKHLEFEPIKDERFALTLKMFGKARAFGCISLAVEELKHLADFIDAVLEEAYFGRDEEE